MQLRFGSDEADEFGAAKAQLIDEFRPWVDDHYGTDDGSLVADAETFLSWRFNYSTGDLGSFTPDDVDEFLLDWAPRKFAVGPGDAPTLCQAVQAMVEFLAVTDRLDGGVAAAAHVMMHVDEIADEVADALGDDSNFGIGKSLASVALADAAGNPLPDLAALLERDDLDVEQLQEILDERMEAFNALPFEERRAHTDRALAAATRSDPIELPFTYVPPLPEDIERSAAASRLVRLVDEYVAHVATEGVPLTSTGNLKLAVARELVERLHTGDELDVDVFGSPSRTRSSIDLRWLTVIDDTATASGAVDRLRTKLVADPDWFERPAMERAYQVIHALLAIGPLRSRPGNWDDDDVTHRGLLDDGIPHWFSKVLVEGSQLDYTSVEELAFEVSKAQRPWLDPDLMGYVVPSRLAELFEMLDFAGLITWHDRVDVHQPYGVRPTIGGGHISLTPLGRFTMADAVRGAGYTFPGVVDLFGGDGLALVNTVATGSLDDEIALRLWHADDTVDERARLLVDAALAADLPEQRLVAFDLLHKLGDPAAVGPLVRELLDSHCAGHAATFLLQHDLATGDDVGMFVDIGPMVDMLATLVDSPADLDQLFRHAQETAESDLIEDIWRHDQPETIELLEALGRHLTDKSMAKAARKAAIKHRSWLANQRR